jgi:RNA polymerase sigma-70 factor (ECF subfamily)
MAADVPGLVEHLFRHEAGRLLAGLGRRLGLEHLDLAEESVQDALVQALRQWPLAGVPPNPAAWLARTAHSRALDRLRRKAADVRARAALERPTAAQPPDGDEQLDDQLAMIFACCHPALAAEAQVALTLKAVCGFGTAEVGRAFLLDEPAVAQRIVRAKRALREQAVALAVPPPAELAQRLDAVLHVLYLLFNEGYSAHRGADLVRHDLCEEALRLGLLLARRPDTAQPKVHALVALMFFQGSRLPARVDDDGDLLLLADQDRAKWDQRLIAAGMRHLDRASAGDELTTYHIEAGIAAIHAQAESESATDWPRLLWLYDRLRERSPTPVVELNRAVALSRVEGPAAALGALEPLAWPLRGYYLLHATRADLLRRLGHRDEAAAAYRAALACPCSEPERRFLMSRVRET